MIITHTHTRMPLALSFAPSSCFPASCFLRTAIEVGQLVDVALELRKRFAKGLLVRRQQRHGDALARAHAPVCLGDRHAGELLAVLFFRFFPGSCCVFSSADFHACFRFRRRPFLRVPFCAVFPADGSATLRRMGQLLRRPPRPEPPLPGLGAETKTISPRQDHLTFTAAAISAAGVECRTVLSLPAAIAFAARDGDQLLVEWTAQQLAPDGSVLLIGMRNVSAVMLQRLPAQQGALRFRCRTSHLRDDTTTATARSPAIRELQVDFFLNLCCVGERAAWTAHLQLALPSDLAALCPCCPADFPLDLQASP